jgi:itaconate CoA-transferase
MLESLAEWMNYPLYYTYEGAPPPARAGASHAAIYPYGPFAASDGGTVVLGLQNEREWKLFCDVVLQQPALASDPRFDSNAKRNEQRQVLTEIVLQAFASLTTEQLAARLDQAQIANARMNDMAGLWAHPQLAARQRWSEIGSPAGPIPALLPPGRVSSFDYRMDAVPAVGEHTEAILRELGRADAEIAALRASSAI